MLSCFRPHRFVVTVSEPYPFESDDDIEIRELDLESVDAVAERRITVSDLAGEHESWRYGHVIVDEAQDLTPMQWRMVMRRVRGQSLTIVGDLAQRSAATAGDWNDVLPAELSAAVRQDLTVNYRSPVEIHELALAVLAEFAPQVAPSTAIRASGSAPAFVQVGDMARAVANTLTNLLTSVGGQIAVIGTDLTEIAPDESGEDDVQDRVRYLTPNESKGLEFDAVILVEPADIWGRPGGPAQLYIALTRATQQLTVLYNKDVPAPLI